MTDSHDHLGRVDDAIKEFRALGITELIHCGDTVSPFTVLRFKDAGFTRMVFVRGNNDGELIYLEKIIKNVGGEFHKPPVFLETAGLKFALLHEPMPHDAMRALPVDVVCYGHTHDIDISTDTRPLIINPGESCGWLKGKATIATLDTETMEVALIELA